MRSQFLLFYIITMTLLGHLWALEKKIRFISTEHPEVTSYNPKYFKYINLTSQRYGRYDPMYYVGVHFTNLVPFDNKVMVDFYFYEWLTNRYKPSFVEMHFGWCDLVHKDPFFGAAMRQGKLARPCPHMPDDYHLYNMTIPMQLIPQNFPFTRGRIIANFTSNNRREMVALGHIDMEIKEVRLRRKNMGNISKYPN